MKRYSDRTKILDAIRRAGFKLIKNLQSEQYFVIEDYGRLQKNERLIKK